MGETVSVLVLIRIVIDTGLGALLSGDRSRSASQRIAAAASLREGNDVADGVCTGQVRSQPRAIPA